MSETLFKFPCEYPLKIMGRGTDEFRSLVVGIVQKHMGSDDAATLEERPSRARTYIGLTFTLQAQSKAQLDALYIELTSCEGVLMVL